MAKRLIFFLFTILSCSNLLASTVEDCFCFIQNLTDQASKQMEGLAQQEGIKKIADGLYIKTLNEGTGSEVLSENDSPLVTLKVYELKPGGDNHPYVVDNPKKINLSHCIPGIRAGVAGMKLGEMRRIYIHPSIGHGELHPFFSSEVVYYDMEIVSLNREIQ